MYYLSLIKPLPHNPDFLRHLIKKNFENIEGKGENAGNQHFLLFPQCFPTQSKTEISILPTSNLMSANALNLVTTQILLLVKG